MATANMTARRQREALQVEIQETVRVMNQVSGHPIMNFSFNQRLAELKNELAELPAETTTKHTDIEINGISKG